MKIERKTKYFSLLLVAVCVFALGATPASAATLINETIQVPALSYYHYRFTTQADNPTLTIEVSALFDISVYVMDSSNFATWEAGGTADAYVSKERVVDTTFQVTLGAQGTYEIVFDNTYALLTAKTVDVNVDITYPQQATGDTFILLIIGGVVLLVVIGAIVVILLIVRPKSKRPTPVAPAPQTYQPPQPTAPKKGRFCINCGYPLRPNQQFCENCGKETT